MFEVGLDLKAENIDSNKVEKINLGDMLDTYIQAPYSLTQIMAMGDNAFSYNDKNNTLTTKIVLAT